jgi:hypothetical protein
MLLASYDRSFKVQAIAIIIVNYDRTVVTIINYNCKTFIVHATGWHSNKCDILSTANLVNPKIYPKLGYEIKSTAHLANPKFRVALGQLHTWPTPNLGWH